MPGEEVRAAFGLDGELHVIDQHIKGNVLDVAREVEFKHMADETFDALRQMREKEPLCDGIRREFVTDGVPYVLSITVDPLYIAQERHGHRG